ncbi:MAG: uncharacterized protein H6Q89_4713 [Myxococcaceae bacterium]|nr:uncharacterized protein [Myxococcaceae bacterium]
MPRTANRFAPMVAAFAVLAACGQTGGGCSGGCAQLGPIPGGRFTGTRLDTAAAARLSADGFTVINAYSPQLLDMIAPGGQLVVPLPCSIQSALLENLTIGDEGALYCTAESCGQLDGKCDTKDVAKPIVVNITSLVLAPKGPDLIEASLDITLATGKIMISSVSRNSALCLFSSPVKCSVDLDTARTTPLNNELKVNIRFIVDPRWDKVLSFEIPDIGGAKACGTAGALPKPACIDAADMLVASEGSCGFCTLANFNVVKTLIVDQLTKSLKDRLETALRGANCRKCGAGDTCPTSAVATSACVFPADGGSPDGGECIDTGTSKCVPSLIGVEGRMALGQALGGVVPQGSGLDLSIAAGGAATSSPAGLTVGFTGGAKEVAVADCVKPLAAPLPPALPLPDFDLDAPGPYDVGFSVSQQMLTEAFFHAQQSGALCLELGNEQMAQLDSALLGTLLPSLNLLTGKNVSVPLRVVIRPVTPPRATVGEGTLDPVTMKPKEPLIRFDWDGVEIDLYARLEERYVRLFTVSADVKLPIGLSLTGCSDVTPVIGDLTGAITNVKAKNSEILAEQLTALETLVPSLLTFAEPTLARGLQAFTVPEFGGWKIRLLASKGVGLISGTKSYNHLGIYAKLIPYNQSCVVMSPRLKVVPALLQGSRAMLKVEALDAAGPEYQYRVNGGFWSTWRPAGPDGLLEVNHPRLLLRAAHQVEVRMRDARRPEGISPVVAVTVAAP